MVTRRAPISAVKVAIDASVNSQSIAFEIFGCAQGYFQSIRSDTRPLGEVVHAGVTHGPVQKVNTARTANANIGLPEGCKRLCLCCVESL
jgi:hypothetical protein